MPRSFIDTPLGPLAVESDGILITRIFWTDDLLDRANDSTPDILKEAISQLTAYFEGRLKAFTLPLAPAASSRGNALRKVITAIPYGDTASYGALARMIGSGARAVGQACARNPFPILVPCHRVLAANGALGNYSGGRGATTKLGLLRLEQSEFQPLL